MANKKVPLRRAPRPQHDPRYQRLAGLLRSVRKEKGITQVRLGELLGRDQTFVAKVERCSRRIDPIEMIVWLRACRADAHQFFSRVLRF